MARTEPPQSAESTKSEALSNLGRYAGPATLILSSLADGTKHGYALTKDIEQFAEVRIAPGTLYEALARLERQGLIEPVESHDRRRPYRLTAPTARSPSECISILNDASPMSGYGASPRSTGTG